MKMPFGKYRGQAVSQLPDEYLDWLLGIELRSPLLEAVGAEFWRRRGERGSPSQRCNAPTLSITVKPWEVPLLRDMVERGYRALAKSNHPDAGGSTEVMQRINGLADSLKTQLASIEGRA